MQRHLRRAEHGDDVLEVRLKVVADRERDVAECRQDLRLDVAVHGIALHEALLQVRPLLLLRWHCQIWAAIRSLSVQLTCQQHHPALTDGRSRR